MSGRYDNYIEYLNSTLHIPTVQPYTAIDLFAGCGGLSLGFEAAGIKTIGYEMPEDCCNTYRNNLNTECRQEKIATNSEYSNVRIIIGGPPCQPFSKRGKQKGQMADKEDSLSERRQDYRVFLIGLNFQDPKKASIHK